MARFTRMQVLNTMVEQGLVPIFYSPDADVAKKATAVCAAGGGRIVEFTNRGDFAWQVFTELARHVAEACPEVILGVGSVTDAPTAAIYIASGANFVVAPQFNPEVARLCNRRKIAYIPGCGTVSEISQAEEYGVEIVKIFPGGSVGGPEFVRTVLGPCPWTRILPTGGVEASAQGIKAWFDAGAACVGMGSNLISKQRTASGDYEAISKDVAQVLGWIQAARSG